MTDPAVLDAALAALPIFPLPGTVFFPHTLLPLHVFEPRYRQMTEQVLSREGAQQLMAIVAIDDDDDAGRSVRGVHRVGGLGRVVHHERLPDGRFHLLLQGIARVALDDELPMEGRLYRRVRARVLSSTEPDPSHADSEVATLRSCYARLVDADPSCKDALGDLPLRIADPSVLSDVVCASALTDVAARQRALEETDVVRRLKAANDALATLLLKSLTTDAAGMH